MKPWHPAHGALHESGNLAAGKQWQLSSSGTKFPSHTPSTTWGWVRAGPGPSWGLGSGSVKPSSSLQVGWDCMKPPSPSWGWDGAVSSPFFPLEAGLGWAALCASGWDPAMPTPGTGSWLPARSGLRRDQALAFWGKSLSTTGLEEGANYSVSAQTNGSLHLGG